MPPRASPGEGPYRRPGPRGVGPSAAARRRRTNASICRLRRCCTPPRMTHVWESWRTSRTRVRADWADAHAGAVRRGAYPPSTGVPPSPRRDASGALGVLTRDVGRVSVISASSDVEGLPRWSGTAEGSRH